MSASSPVPPVVVPAIRADDPLSALLTLVAKDMSLVNATILERMQSPIALIPQLAGHIVAAGGKRIRPALTLASASLCGYAGGDAHVKLAAAVELLHTATLLHDDVVDESDLRRGQASANALFGNKSSVLVGDFLFSRSFELMVEVGSLSVLGILARASSIISEGEIHQLITANDISTTQDDYLKVVQGKTAALFAAACQVGGEIAAQSAGLSQALHRYGTFLGIAFQLVDDALDYSARQEKLGKAVGDDFREGKITLPVIVAVAHASDEERAFWRRVMEDLEQTSEDLARAQNLMRRHGCLEATLEQARCYGEQAKNALSAFPVSPVRRIMEGVVDFCIARAY